MATHPLPPCQGWGLQGQPARFEAVGVKAEGVHLQAQNKLSSQPGTTPHPAMKSSCLGQDKQHFIICLVLREENGQVFLFEE